MTSSNPEKVDLEDLPIPLWLVEKEPHPKGYSPLDPLSIQRAVAGPFHFVEPGTLGLAAEGKVPRGWRQVKLMGTVQDMVKSLKTDDGKSVPVPIFL